MYSLILQENEKRGNSAGAGTRGSAPRALRSQTNRITHSRHFPWPNIPIIHPTSTEYSLNGYLYRLIRLFILFT